MLPSDTLHFAWRCETASPMTFLTLRARNEKSRSQLPFCQHKTTHNGRTIACSSLLPLVVFSASPQDNKCFNIISLRRTTANTMVACHCWPPYHHFHVTRVSVTAAGRGRAVEIANSSNQQCPEAMINMRININFMIEVNKKWEKTLVDHFSFNNWICSLVWYERISLSALQCSSDVGDDDDDGGIF